MDDTGAIRKKMLHLWKQFDAGKVQPAEARIHIGFARTVLETLKVEIAAAHLSQLNIPTIDLEGQRKNGQRRLAA